MSFNWHKKQTLGLIEIVWEYSWVQMPFKETTTTIPQILITKFGPNQGLGFKAIIGLCGTRARLVSTGQLGLTKFTGQEHIKTLGWSIPG